VILAISSVLVPTDFSAVGDAAIPFAYAAADDESVVHLLHVIEAVEPLAHPNPLYAHYVPGRAPTPEERERQHAELAARLRTLIPVGAEARGIRTEIHVVESEDVAEAIDKLADELAVSLVCLGSHGHFGLTAAITGSVARDVLATSRHPVLVVPAMRMGT
jgi:nucleotide-binding universal stress UspA family protein